MIVMRYPKLVLKKHCTTPISVTLTESGIGKDGEPLSGKKVTTLCNYQSKVIRAVTNDRVIFKTIGVALFHDDIFPEIDDPVGSHVVIFDKKRKIENISKERNPDGSVNFIRIEIE